MKKLTFEVSDKLAKKLEVLAGDAQLTRPGADGSDTYWDAWRLARWNIGPRRTFWIDNQQYVVPPEPLGADYGARPRRNRAL